MSSRSTRTILRRRARFAGKNAFVWFENLSREAVFEREELSTLARLFPSASLRVTRNGRGRPYVRLRWREDGRERQESVGRLLECARGAGNLKYTEVRFRDGDTLNLHPTNRLVSARGRFRGRETAWLSTAYRIWWGRIRKYDK
jgi:hypothetical protein